MTFKIFEKFPNLKYGISEKRDGSMKTVTAEAAQGRNRLRFFKKQGIDPRNFVIPIQNHSSVALTVNNDNAGKAMPASDALVTKTPGLFLGITVADCFSVYFFDKVKSTIGIAHCGWRGTVGELAINTAKVMASNPKNLLVGIGPGIQSCHFEIKKDILLEFQNHPKAIVIKADKIFIDLPQILTEQLIGLGVPKNHIEKSPDCTFHERSLYFSFRRDKPEVMEAMVAYIGLNNRA